MEIKEICRLIEEREEELFELLSSLVKINSENFGTYGNEKECASYINELCLNLGLESEIYTPLAIEGMREHPDYLPGRKLEERYNVSARWKGRENQDELMLMAHLDTVKIGDEANWKRNPLSGEICDGKIFGRGACDDKYAIAAALFVIKLLKESGFVPKANLIFSAYGDEEVGGSHGALAAVIRYPCNSILNMDGREGELWNCAAGGEETLYKFKTGEAVDNADRIARAMPIVMDEIEKFGDKRRKELEENSFYKGTVIPKTALRFLEVRAGNDGVALGTGEIKICYYTDKTKDEIYKELADVEEAINRRLAPLGMTGEGFVPYTRFFRYGFSENENKDIETLIEAAQEATGALPHVCGSCMSDLSVILKYGSEKAFAYGTGRHFNADGGAHQINEYIFCDKLLEYTKNIAGYVIKMLR